MKKKTGKIITTLLSIIAIGLILYSIISTWNNHPMDINILALAYFVPVSAFLVGINWFWDLTDDDEK